MALDGNQYRKWINGLILKGMETVYRRDRGTELKTLKKMALAGNQYWKWINGLTLKGNGRGEEEKEVNPELLFN
jgi:hypothetical protein